MFSTGILSNGRVWPLECTIFRKYSVRFGSFLFLKRSVSVRLGSIAVRFCAFRGFCGSAVRGSLRFFVDLVMERHLETSTTKTEGWSGIGSLSCTLLTSPPLVIPASGDLPEALPATISLAACFHLPAATYLQPPAPNHLPPASLRYWGEGKE